MADRIVDKTRMPSSNRIYISRQTASKRRVINFDALKPILEEFEIAIVDPSDYTIFEQIHLFSKVKLLIGPHGAGLVNMLFMKEGQTAIELRNSYPDGNNIYERLAKLKCLNYKALARDSNGIYKGDFQNEDILVPIRELRIYIETLL